MTTNTTSEVWVSELVAAKVLGLRPATLRTWRWLEKHRGLPQRVVWRKFGGAVRYHLPSLLQVTNSKGNDEAA